MNNSVKSIRPFIGSQDFEISRSFYSDLGFEEHILEARLSVFKMGETAFYLQDYYSQKWIENTMIFMEVDNVVQFYSALLTINLTDKYNGVKLTPIKSFDWGSECFLHDPSGILWHFGEFNK